MLDWIISRLNIGEVSGAFGDIGTVIPILVSMSKLNLINISTSFFWYGINNIFLGYFDLPMTVQPQKTISALAIKGELDDKGVICSGVFVGVITFILAISGTLNYIAYLVPHHLISVIQMSQGLIFITQGVKIINNVNLWVGIDSYLTSIITALFIFITWLPWKNRKIKKYTDMIPTALVIFIIGIIMAGIRYNSLNSYYITNPVLFPHLSENDFISGIKGAFTQLPLTLLNSVISTVDLAHKLFPGNKLNINNISYSICLINIPNLIGSSPCCLGCGSLSSNTKFKGKTGLVPVILGIIYILFSLLLGSILLDLIKEFPNSMLGVMLIVSGGELSVAGSSKVKENILDYCICVGISLSINIHTGFIAGIIMHIIREFVSLKYNTEEELQNLTSSTEMV